MEFTEEMFKGLIDLSNAIQRLKNDAAFGSNKYGFTEYLPAPELFKIIKDNYSDLGYDHRPSEEELTKVYSFAFSFFGRMPTGQELIDMFNKHIEQVKQKGQNLRQSIDNNAKHIKQSKKINKQAKRSIARGRWGKGSLIVGGLLTVGALATGGWLVSGAIAGLAVAAKIATLAAYSVAGLVGLRRAAVPVAANIWNKIDDNQFNSKMQILSGNGSAMDIQDSMQEQQTLQSQYNDYLKTQPKIENLNAAVSQAEKEQQQLDEQFLTMQQEYLAKQSEINIETQREQADLQTAEVNQFVSNMQAANMQNAEIEALKQQLNTNNFTYTAPSQNIVNPEISATLYSDMLNKQVSEEEINAKDEAERIAKEEQERETAEKARLAEEKRLQEEAEERRRQERKAREAAEEAERKAKEEAERERILAEEKQKELKEFTDKVKVANVQFSEIQVLKEQLQENNFAYSAPQSTNKENPEISANLYSDMVKAEQEQAKVQQILLDEANKKAQQITHKLQHINKVFVTELFTAKSSLQKLDDIIKTAETGFKNLEQESKKLDSIIEKNGTVSEKAKIADSTGRIYGNLLRQDTNHFFGGYNGLLNLSNTINKDNIQNIIYSGGKLTSTEQVTEFLNQCKIVCEQLSQVNNLDQEQVQSTGYKFIKNDNFDDEYIQVTKKSGFFDKLAKEQLYKENDRIENRANNLDRWIKSAPDKTKKDKYQTELDELLDDNEIVDKFNKIGENYFASHIQGLKDGAETVYRIRKDYKDTLLNIQHNKDSINELLQMVEEFNNYSHENNIVNKSAPVIEQVSLDEVREEQKEMGITQPEILVQQDKPLTPEEEFQQEQINNQSKAK